ncbi:DUF2357 domain-containing protein [Paenibacillus dokdonensis]|uniref:DUF2357 domain-containing protein n=1 Tax=Paenibacillus dokdonensis TaxID=2567944 RepID=UPI0010A8DA9D|nr:DUF2357 domain-containing protein [Paenibacillus dokdonensis]
MVLHYNPTISKVAVRLDSLEISILYNGTLHNKVELFYTDEDVLEEKLSFELTENKFVSIQFQATDKSARLYMYGLESLSDEKLEVDEDGEVYLSPSVNPVDLYAKDYYPLIPGKYLAKVISTGFTYFLPFCVHSKQVTEDQLEIMKKDLEEVVTGLAIDFVKKVYSAADNSMRALPPQLLRQFMTIKKHYPSVMAALSDIYKKANYRIRKDYRWTKENHASQIDQVTVRTLQTRSFHEGQLLTPFSAIDYDLPENRWVKFIIRNVLTLLDQFVDSLEIYKNNLVQDIEKLGQYKSIQESTRREIIEKELVLTYLEEYSQLVHRMRIGFQMIVHAPWYQEITNKAFTHVPHNLLSDSRYRALYQLHRHLKEEEIDIFIDSSLTYQWKRTDKLYEMWGFIHILKLFIHMGFQPKSGWFYNRSAQDNSLLIPHLPSGEQVIMIRDDMRIHYVYDGVLPLASNQTNIDNLPLYMGKHNRPDTRVDFYKKDVYVGSLIIDFKYRPMNNFWRSSLQNSMARPREMEQLIAYKRDSNSKFLYGEEKGRNFREMHSPRPVREVWAMYAEAREDWKNHLFLSDDKLRIISMNPGQNHTEVNEHLGIIINFMDNILDHL